MPNSIDLQSKFRGCLLGSAQGDAIGELANMVAGDAKKEFRGVNVSFSLPSVIIGKQHVVSTSRQAPRIVIPCETEFGPVYVEVGMTVEETPRQHPVAAAGA